ncbi:MAG: BrnT family toxin [Spirochaetota bacterium]|jgi:uncharacterized DUF497 family protein|nr:BrnT family toxin [Spirochaetota bacterium]
MDFEWDPEKEKENFKKHGVHFLAATGIFEDSCRVERPDADSSDDEYRVQTIGYCENMLFVVYTERGDSTRIISARLAESFERRIYHGDCEAYGWTRAHP